VASLHNAVFDESNDFYPYDDRLTYIANSDFTAAMFQKHTGMRAEVLYPLVQPDWYHVDPVGEFVTFVNPTPVKGLDIALALAERRPDIPFQFVESWPLRRPALRSLKTQLQRLGNVTLLPRTEDMRSVYGRSRLILMPTRIDEAWGRVVTEAQVSGIPAIAADRGGLPESVGSGGILVDPAGPISAWVDALGRLWDEPEAYAAACDAARTHAERPAIQVDTLMGRFMAILAKQAATA
jgi:glycosyltransferase involved in cell wall biosynthesis